MANNLPYNASTDCLNSSMVNCTLTSKTPSPILPTPSLSDAQITIILVNCIIMVLGVPGNLYVIYKFAFTSEKRHAGVKLVVALAVTDCLSSLILPSFTVYDMLRIFLNNGVPIWHLEKFMCYVLYATHPIFFGTSSWYMVAISCERLR